MGTALCTIICLQSLSNATPLRQWLYKIGDVWDAVLDIGIYNLLMALSVMREIDADIDLKQQTFKSTVDVVRGLISNEPSQEYEYDDNKSDYVKKTRRK
ncbi:hypothetical protein RUM43_013861 [Polyplax serrata]|uniref:Uncharacterized protein n=1 Tax=Polyplax serrata TaxID=468196 RepID=A0AAN8S680_POLSC